jgi:AcrR family transcriptional regulator
MALLDDESLTATLPAAPTSRREEAKSGRRGRIVDTACALLREAGVDELSVKTIAARAGVSVSTVYNLFDSKEEVLANVSDLDLVQFEQRVAAALSQDALARIFDAIDIAAELYRADPGFYRAIMCRMPGGAGDPALSVALRAFRNPFWRAMVEAALAEGQLKPRTDPAVLATLLIQIFGGVLSNWVAGEITTDQLRAQARFGFAVALSAFASRPAAGRLRGQIDELHAALSHGRRAVEAAPPLSAGRTSGRSRPGPTPPNR